MRRSYRKFVGLTSLIFFISTTIMTGCAYQLGLGERRLPSGYKLIAVPVFKNQSMEPGIEVSFTKALIQEFERSRLGEVTPKEQAEVIVEGEIMQVDAAPGNIRDGGTLPLGTVLVGEYTLNVSVRIRLKKAADDTILWEGDFNGIRSYVAPQVTKAIINTVNPLYNLSARRQNIDVLATKIMAEAHDRMTENF